MELHVELTRRGWLRALTTGAVGASSSGWLGRLAAASTPERRRPKSVILLWLAGGPSTIDLWDLKPGHANGGPFREIATATPGVRVSEHLPRLARWTDSMAIVRSMASREGDHGRATRYLQTGYLPGAGIDYPPLGSLVARENGRAEADLPHFVSIAPNRTLLDPGGGFLGPHYAPLAVGRDASSAEELKVPDLHRPDRIGDADQAGRLGLLERFEMGREPWRGAPVVDGLHAASARALRLMRPVAQAAFRLDDEAVGTREAYGPGVFGQGCLLARRLVERGVPFVEVTLGGWDTHYDNFERVATLSGILDLAFSALLRDLSDRGLLDSTLVVCQGEFGRTPKINGTTGRDHWPQSWAVAMAGGGVRGGQAVGETSPDGTEIIEGRASVPDLIATVCKAVDIEPRKQNDSNVGRPIRIADPAAREIAGIL
ncbi:DUF1501 domain-containing protein [Tundrisphaera lichenicola]|uniref:DUF1501 domain-containing protein n=1 Tax=Tundrisphaera lichenicola TaxID=2029860 RepID=UPI003EBE724B